MKIKQQLKELEVYNNLLQKRLLERPVIKNNGEALVVLSVVESDADYRILLNDGKKYSLKTAFNMGTLKFDSSLSFLIKKGVEYLELKNKEQMDLHHQHLKNSRFG